MKRRQKWGYLVLFISPAFLVYTVLMIFPLFDSVRIGFYTEIDNQVVFGGLRNYAALLLGPVWSVRFWNALKNSLVFVIVNLLIQNPLALLLASVLSNETRGSIIYRTLFFAPATLSLVIVAFIWKMLLNPLWGLPVTIMGSAIPLLGLEKTALVTLALVYAWQNIGVPISLYYASLAAIPESLMEAAGIDGAAISQKFWRIKLPLVLPMVGVVCLMTFLANIAMFDIVYALKGGFAGPNFSTDTMMTLFFRTFFGYYNSPSNPYMGAAVAGTMMVILLLGVLVYSFWKNRQPVYEY